MTPKYNLLYFKHLIDYAIVEFVNEFNDSFTLIDEKYVLTKQFTKQKLKNILLKYILECLLKYIKPYNRCSPEYYLIIGACVPKNNLLMGFKDGSSFFPNKLTKVIEQSDLKYVLKENDIDIDIALINEVINLIFDDLFSTPRNLPKKFKELFNNSFDKNVIFIAHNRLDCYAMFKALKMILGKNNCINVFVETDLNKMQMPIVAVNELIDKYIHNKIPMIHSSEFMEIKDNIQEYLKLKMI